MDRRSFLGAGALIAADTGIARLGHAETTAFLAENGQAAADGKATDQSSAEISANLAQEAAEAARTAAESIDIRRVPDMDALRTLNTDTTKLAFLPDDTGFDWKDVDSTEAARLDPNEHILVRDPKKPLAFGAWYRRLKGDEPSVRDGFKAKGDGRADDTAALQDAIYWMEYYPLRSRALTWERGVYNVSQLIIPDEITGVSFNGRSFWDSTIMCHDGGSEPLIRNASQEFKMFDLSLLSARPNTDNWNDQKNGLHNDRGDGQRADVDVTISRCRIAGFYQGVYHKGRGLSAHGNHFASCHFGISLDWPDLGSYVPSDTTGDDVFDDPMGFRGIAISDTRFHSLNYAAVANVGLNAAKIVGLKINDISLDIGRRIFYGHLGTHGSITNSTSTLSATEILELTGGLDFNVSGITGGGNAKNGARTPTNLIKLTDGLFTAGRFSNITLSNCEEHAIHDNSTCLEGVTFSDITFHNVGFSAPETSRAFSFGSQNSDIEVVNTKLVGADRLQGVVGNNFSNNRIRAINLSKTGNDTPWTIGSPIVLVGKRQRYSPELIPVTNIADISATVLDWIYVDDDLIEIGGRFAATAVEAGNCEVDLPLPVAAVFEQPQDAWGSLIAATPGMNVAGVAVANGNMLRLRWLAPKNKDISFCLTARYGIR
ncbi:MULTISPECIES: hypothetical protein [unclassified Rhizobium]|uniref:hypothetical protein n=1 Tax=unclassified Rhizobium TaxID=2613769 RepID=UPI0007137BAA|nr:MULTISPECIES: hypothetical protein [unclassified Rhizobium]KQS89470.1 hypothetical protein ASG42_12205 [Rhizobium sp. Leaf391]KQS94749.1 hypothetical protein ASG50_26155 [Rhizobium sp. Leaf386]KQU01127.1 hypothetical protein ASG68_04935 [Rhizobium sp. Leaf453]